MTSNEQYTGPPNASLGTLGVLFSAFGQALGRRQQPGVRHLARRVAAPGGAPARRTRRAIRTLAPSSPGGRWPSPTSIPTCFPTSVTAPATVRRWPRSPGSTPLIAVRERRRARSTCFAPTGRDALGTTGGLPNVLVVRAHRGPSRTRPASWPRASPPSARRSSRLLGRRQEAAGHST